MTALPRIVGTARAKAANGPKKSGPPGTHADLRSTKLKTTASSTTATDLIVNVIRASMRGSPIGGHRHLGPIAGTVSRETRGGGRNRILDVAERILAGGVTATILRSNADVLHEQQRRSVDAPFVLRQTASVSVTLRSMRGDATKDQIGGHSRQRTPTETTTP